MFSPFRYAAYAADTITRFFAISPLLMLRRHAAVFAARFTPPPACCCYADFRCRHAAAAYAIYFRCRLQRAIDALEAMLMPYYFHAFALRYMLPCRFMPMPPPYADILLLRCRADMLLIVSLLAAAAAALRYSRRRSMLMFHVSSLRR